MFSVAFWLASVALAVAVSGVVWSVFSGGCPHRHHQYENAIRDVRAELLECLDALDKLTVVAKRKYARDAARDKRTGKPNGAELTDDEWKKQMESQLALKRAGVITDAN